MSFNGPAISVEEEADAAQEVKRLRSLMTRLNQTITEQQMQLSLLKSELRNLKGEAT